MKLFILIPECPYPDNTGGRLGLFKQIEYLSRGNEIFLFGIVNDPSESDKAIEELKKYCSKIFFFPRKNKFFSIIESIAIPYAVASRTPSKFRKTILKEYVDCNPDFIIVNFPQMLKVLPNQLKQSGKIVLIQHNVEYLTMLSISKNCRNLLKRIAFWYSGIEMRAYEKKMYKNLPIKAQFFVSDKDRKCLINEFHLSNTFLYPVGSEIDYLPFATNCHNVLLVGTMNYSPNVEGALWVIEKVLPALIESIPDVHLYVVGKNPVHELLSKQSPNVTITGTVPDIEPYYKKANVVLVPIFSGGGVKTKLLEALGKNRIVVATTNALQGTTFEPGDDLLVANDADRFAEQVKLALQNQDNYARVALNGFQKVRKKYSWEKVVGDLNSELLSLKK